MIISLGITPTVQRTLHYSRLTLDAVNRTGDVHVTASGKAVNVARVIHTLGGDVLAMGLIGGYTAPFMQQDMDSAGFAHDFVQIPHLTRTCTTVIDASTGHATELVEESTPVSIEAINALLTRLASRLTGANILSLSGSLTPQAPADFYARCIQLAHAANVPSILDAKGPELLAALPHHPLLIKPNASELATTFKCPVDSDDALIAAMHQACRLGAEWCLVSRGPKPAILTDGTSNWQASIPPIRPVSPIGSGDSLCAGLALQISRGLSPVQALPLGIAAACANALRPIAGFLDPAEVDTLAKQVVVTPV